MEPWLNRYVRCVAKTSRTSVIIGQVNLIHEQTPGEWIFIVSIEGTLTAVEIDIEFWVLETLDNKDTPRLYLNT